MKQCILMSGGMDSYLAWRLFAPQAVPVFVDIGQPYLAKELDAMWDIAPNSFKYLKATRIAQHPLPSGIILHRNALLILTAASHYSEIILGVLADEINSDKSAAFFAAMETALNISHAPQYWNDNLGQTYKVHSPVRHLTKSALVGQYLAAGLPAKPLLATVSCYSAAPGHCGHCPSCFKRWVALKNNGLQQPFAADPCAWAQGQGILAKAQNGTYSAQRTAEILAAIQ